MRFLAALAFALPLAAQLEVFSLHGPVPVPVGATLNLGSAASGDSTDFRFRVRNRGLTALTVQSISVTGTAFSLAASFVPLTLAPEQSHDFAVRFSPAGQGSYSATLTVNNFSAILRAASVPGPSLFAANGAQTTELTGSSLQVNLPASQPLLLALSIGNPHPAPLTIGELAIAGAGFTLVDPPALPLVLPPGETRAIPVRISIATEGEWSAALTIGPRRFTILAAVFRPRLPAPRILSSEAVPRNGQQIKLRLQFDQPAAAASAGTLRATFTGALDDPAIVFPNGSREILFQVASGSRDATFDGANETVLQTGTTAGVLRIDAITESGIATESYRFERGLIVVDEATARRNGSNLEIEITGFDNTRAAGSLNFRFFDRSGSPLGGVLTVTPGDIFKTYFDQSNLGGVFRLRAAFPVTGDATIVGSVLVEIANPVGRTDLQRLTFP